jgi:hypothetical protein
MVAKLKTEAAFYTTQENPAFASSLDIPGEEEIEYSG